MVAKYLWLLLYFLFYTFSQKRDFINTLIDALNRELICDALIEQIQKKREIYSDKNPADSIFKPSCGSVLDQN